MQKLRINFGMSVPDCIFALSEGNPGAISVVFQLAQSAAKVDPDSILGAFGPMAELDTNGVYGSRIWRLYKDVCREKIVHVIGLLRAVQLGHLPRRTLDRAIDGDHGAVNVADELAYVRSFLPQFAVEVA